MSPLISSFDGMRVRMNELDHEPTHLHVVYQGREELEEPAHTVMDGVLAFDVTGKRDPYDMIDICADVVYADGEPVSGRARTPSAPQGEK